MGLEDEDSAVFPSSEPLNEVGRSTIEDPSTIPGLNIDATELQKIIPVKKVRSNFCHSTVLEEE